MNPPLADHTLPVRPRKRFGKRLLVVIALLYLVSLFVPLVWPYAWYPLYVLKCGHRPIIATDFAAGMSYVTPESPRYIHSLSPFATEFFCSEAEAIENGYHKSSFNH